MFELFEVNYYDMIIKQSTANHEAVAGSNHSNLQIKGFCILRK